MNGLQTASNKVSSGPWTLSGKWCKQTLSYQSSFPLPANHPLLPIIYCLGILFSCLTILGAFQGLYSARLLLQVMLDGKRCRLPYTRTLSCMSISLFWGGGPVVPFCDVRDVVWDIVGDDGAQMLACAGGVLVHYCIEGLRYCVTGTTTRALTDEDASLDYDWTTTLTLFPCLHE